jgi:hypothetical protein
MFSCLRSVHPTTSFLPRDAGEMKEGAQNGLNDLNVLNQFERMFSHTFSHRCMFHVFMFWPPVSARGVTPVNPFLIASHSRR